MTTAENAIAAIGTAPMAAFFVKKRMDFLGKTGPYPPAFLTAAGKRDGAEAGEVYAANPQLSL